GRSQHPIEVVGISAFGSSISGAVKLENDQVSSVPARISIPAEAAITQPYWLKEPPPSPYQYSVSADSPIGLPGAPNPLYVNLQVRIADQIIPLTLPLSFKKLDPIKGDVVEALRIVPPVNLRFQQELYIQKNNSALKVGVRLQNRTELSHGELHILQDGRSIASLKNLQLTAGSDTTFQ